LSVRAPVSTEDHIRTLIRETRAWRASHLSARPPRQIEALACLIRLKALYDALGEHMPREEPL
jgi:hypothetical protein